MATLTLTGPVAAGAPIRLVAEPPVISEVVQSPNPVRRGETVRISVAATEPQSQRLIYIAKVNGETVPAVAAGVFDYLVPPTGDLALDATVRNPSGVRAIVKTTIAVDDTPLPDPDPEPPPGAITHGSQLTPAMTGYGALGIAQVQLEVLLPPSRGYWRGDSPTEFSLSTPYVYSNDPLNKGGVVPAGGMVIDGYTIPAGTRVVQFRDFSAGDFYLTGSTSFMWRGCRFRGRSSAPGYFNCAAGYGGRLYFFHNDLGGLGSASGDFNEVPVKVANAAGMTAYRNRVQFTTTGFQPNISGPIEITENFISDLTTFGTDAHLNGITHNGGENNSKIVRNHIVVRSPDTSGRAVGQTDCVSFFQDFGDFDGAGAKLIDANYLGGTGYCIYAGMNAGKPATSVQNMVVTNNLITTEFYPRGGTHGPIAAEPPWGVQGNVAINNRWADGPNAGQLAFGS